MKKITLLLGLVILASLAARSWAAEALFLADQSAQPGVVLSASGGQQLGEVFRRGARVAEDHPGAVGKIQSLAAAQDGSLFFASGLDGYIFQLRNRRETLVYTHRGQVRDLALGAGGNTLFFSVLPTPQEGEPLSDGQIFELDLRTGMAGLFTNVRQRELDHGWWGAFAFSGEQLYLGTIGKPSRIYQVVDDLPRGVLEVYDLPILGLAVSSHGDLFYAGGGEKVFVARDGRDPAVAAQSVGRRLCDVTLAPHPRREIVARPVEALPVDPPAPPTDDDLAHILGTFRAEAEDRWGHALLLGPDDRERLHGMVKISPHGDFRFDGLREGRYWVILGRADLDLTHVLRPAVIEVDTAAGASHVVEFRLETRGR